MEKILSLVLTMALAVTLTACGNADSTGQAESTVVPGSVPQEEETESAVPDNRAEESENTEGNTESGVIEQDSAENGMEQPAELTDMPEKSGSRILVTYFSRIGENYSVGYIEKGNTHIIADMIAEQTGGDTFEIRTVAPYPDDYDECTDIAQQERNGNARPELAESLDNLDDYDVIFMGYPIWWGDMPMAIYTFLESYDFSGKTIVPFCTHEGSGLSSTEESIAAACPDAEILDGLSIRGSVAQNSQEEAAEAVTEWLRQAGLIESLPEEDI